jgi:hypothetical protein
MGTVLKNSLRAMSFSEPSQNTYFSYYIFSSAVVTFFTGSARVTTPLPGQW